MFVVQKDCLLCCPFPPTSVHSVLRVMAFSAVQRLLVACHSVLFFSCCNLKGSSSRAPEKIEGNKAVEAKQYMIYSYTPAIWKPFDVPPFECHFSVRLSVSRMVGNHVKRLITWHGWCHSLLARVQVTPSQCFMRPIYLARSLGPEGNGRWH